MLRTAIALSLSLASTAIAQSAARRDTTVKAVGTPVHAKMGTLVEELSIGVVDGAEEYVFGDVADLALGPDGSLFVLDRKVPIVRQFDAKGKFVRNIGRLGSGPGEFRSASGIATMKDGRLLLWDTGNWRVNVYSSDGKPQTQWATPSGAANSSATYTRALMVDSAGNLWCRGNIFQRGPAGMARRQVWFRVDAGGIRDTVEMPAMPQVLEDLKAVGSGGSATATGFVPFTPQPFVAQSPFGYFVTGLPSKYAVEIVAPGKPIVSYRRSGVAPIPVTSAERSAERERIETMMRRTEPGWSWNGPEIPPTKPFYSGLSIGLDGRIWLAVVPEARRIGNINGPMGVGMGNAPVRPPAPVSAPKDDRPALYDVLEPDGTLLGQVQVPPRVFTVLRSGDQVWAVALNDDDVAFVKRYRIRWP